MCTRPSRPGTRFTNAPNVVVLTTVPVKCSPTLTGARVRDLVDHPAPPRPRPSPSRGADEHRSRRPGCRCRRRSGAMISLIRLPLGPITSPILSTGIWIVMIARRLGLTSVARHRDRRLHARRGSWSRASCACSSARDEHVAGQTRDLHVELDRGDELARAGDLEVHVAAARPRRRGCRSRVTNLPSSAIMPIAMPATGALIGTPASISDSVDAQTRRHRRRAVRAQHVATPAGARTGTPPRVGITGTSARSASAPWPISRRRGEPTRPVSPVENGGKL